MTDWQRPSGASPNRPLSMEILEQFSTRPPPVNLYGLLDELGLAFEAAKLPTGVSGKITKDRGARAGFKVVVNTDEPPRRQRFTIAHEIAHYVLHRDLIGDGVTDDAMYRSSLADEYERQADRLAGEILLPARALRVAYATEKGLAKLGTMFDASMDAIRIRLKELRLAP